jgi:hypothetical protein
MTLFIASFLIASSFQSASAQVNVPDLRVGSFVEYSTTAAGGNFTPTSKGKMTVEIVDKNGDNFLLRKVTEIEGFVKTQEDWVPISQLPSGHSIEEVVNFCERYGTRSSRTVQSAPIESCEVHKEYNDTAYAAVPFGIAYSSKGRLSTDLFGAIELLVSIRKLETFRW